MCGFFLFICPDLSIIYIIMKTTTDFTQGNIFQKLIQFMLPTLGALVLQAMYGAVDLLVVGRFGSSVGISGVSTGSTFLNMVTFVTTAMATAVTVLIGRRLGEKQENKIGALLGNTITLFTIVAAVFTALMVTLAQPIARLMQAPSVALDVTVQYIRICGGGIVFVIAYNVLSYIFRGLGDSKTPLIFVAVACCINIAGDLLFVAVFHWDVAGAAYATILAQACSVVMALILLKRRNIPFARVHRKDLRPSAEMRHLLSIGLPLALQEFLTQVSFLCLVAFINRLGLNASSGYGVANKIVAFVMLVPSSLMQSMASFVSQNVGAGREDRARKAMYNGMLIGASMGALVVLIIYLWGDVISSLFTSNPAYIAQSWDYLRGFGPEAVVTSVLFSFVGYYNGHQRSNWVLIQALLQTFIVRLPMAYLMSIQPHASLMHIGFAAPSATVFGILLNIGYYIYFRKKYLP